MFQSPPLGDAAERRGGLVAGDAEAEAAEQDVPDEEELGKPGWRARGKAPRNGVSHAWRSRESRRARTRPSPLRRKVPGGGRLSRGVDRVKREQRGVTDRAGPQIRVLNGDPSPLAHPGHVIVFDRTTLCRFGMIGKPTGITPTRTHQRTSCMSTAAANLAPHHCTAGASFAARVLSCTPKSWNGSLRGLLYFYGRPPPRLILHSGLRRDCPSGSHDYPFAGFPGVQMS